MFRLQIHSRYDLIRGENKSLRKKEEKLWNIPFYFNLLFQNIIVPLETFGWCSEKRKSLHEATAAKHPPVKSATTWQADNVCIARQLQLPPVLSVISSGGCMGAFGPFAADLPASAPCLPLFFLSLPLHWRRVSPAKLTRSRDAKKKTDPRPALRTINARAIGVFRAAGRCDLPAPAAVDLDSWIGARTRSCPAVRFCACEGTVVAAPAQCWICFDLTR